MTENKNNRTITWIVGGILILLLAGVSVLLISEKKVNKELTQESGAGTAENATLIGRTAHREK